MAQERDGLNGSANTANCPRDCPICIRPMHTYCTAFHFHPKYSAIDNSNTHDEIPYQQ